MVATVVDFDGQCVLAIEIAVSLILQRSKEIIDFSQCLSRERNGFALSVQGAMFNGHRDGVAVTHAKVIGVADGQTAKSC